MKAKNTQSKIVKIYNQEVITEDKINKFITDSITKKKSVININYVNNLKNKIYDFSTEWIDLDIHIVDMFPATEFNLKYMHKEIRINLSDIPIKQLPFINIKILYKYDDLEDDSLETKNVHESYFFQVSDVIAGIAKNVELIIGIGIDDYYPLQAKVLITIFNPEFCI
ncbi:MAG: hypothetical protein V1901_03875 [Patescibacteria group bacterium]